MGVIRENSKWSLLLSRLPRTLLLFLRRIFRTNPPDPKLMNRSDHGWKWDLNMYECNLVWVKTQPNLSRQICLVSQNIKLSLFKKQSVPPKQGCRIPVPKASSQLGFVTYQVAALVKTVFCLIGQKTGLDYLLWGLGPDAPAQTGQFQTFPDTERPSNVAPLLNAKCVLSAAATTPAPLAPVSSLLLAQQRGHIKGLSWPLMPSLNAAHQVFLSRQQLVLHRIPPASALPSPLWARYVMMSAIVGIHLVHRACHRQGDI